MTMLVATALIGALMTTQADPLLSIDLPPGPSLRGWTGWRGRRARPWSRVPAIWRDGPRPR